MVTDVAEPGIVTLSSVQPQVSAIADGHPHRP